MGRALENNSIFAGRYRIVRCMAHGGMAAVYEVVHLETERRCALKIVHEHLLHSEAVVRRFQREAKIAARVRSEFIVDVFDAGVDTATQIPFLVMELLRGEELGHRIRRVGALPHDEVVSYLRQTALALDKTHRAGVVHRDLKPENLFISENDAWAPRIKVLDFGVAKVLAEAQAGGSTTLSAGTPRYMAPEQFDPYAPITGAADVYALGMIAYSCLVGIPYWLEEVRARNIFAFAAIARLGPRELASSRAERLGGVRLPAGFDAWFAKAAHVDPAQRHASATEAVDALELVLRPSISMPAPPLPSPRPKGRDRRSRTAALVGAGVVGLAILGIGGLRSWNAASASVAEAIPARTNRRQPAEHHVPPRAEHVEVVASPTTADPRPVPAPVVAPVATSKKKSGPPLPRAATGAPPPAPIAKRYTQE
jgi:serine/threonine-protein kinase